MKKFVSAVKKGSFGWLKQTQKFHISLASAEVERLE
jgi:hypothetical protein